MPLALRLVCVGFGSCSSNGSLWRRLFSCSRRLEKTGFESGHKGEVSKQRRRYAGVPGANGNTREN